MNSSEINYPEKIQNFMAFTENYSEEIALNYLQKTDWDEGKAAQLYFDSINFNSNSQPESYSDHQENNRDSQQQAYQEEYPSYSQFQSEGQSQNEQGFVSKYIGSPIKSILGSIGRTFFGGSTPTLCTAFDKYSFNLKTKDQLSKSLNNKIGIVIFYQDCDIEYLNKLEQSIAKEQYILDILKENFVLNLNKSTSTDASAYLKILNQNIQMPSFWFFRKSITKSNVMNKIEGFATVEIFRDALIKNIELDETKNIGSQFEYHNDNDMENLSHGDTISIQKEQLRRLELEEDRKNKQEKDQKKKEVQDREERENKLKLEAEEKALREQEKLEFINKKRNRLNSEPEISNSNSINIIFRCPDGVTRKERRFLKTDKIQTLYDFIDTIAEGILTESDKFELVEPFPFKLYNSMDKTLEEEKITNNSLIQIREV